MVKGLSSITRSAFFPVMTKVLSIVSYFLAVQDLVQKVFFFIEKCENHGAKNDMSDKEKKNYLQGVHRILC